jgi:hypothetical protein
MFIATTTFTCHNHKYTAGDIILTPTARMKELSLVVQVNDEELKNILCKEKEEPKEELLYELSSSTEIIIESCDGSKLND